MISACTYNSDYLSMATDEGVIDVDDQQDNGVEVPGEGEGDIEGAKPKLRSVVWEHFPYDKYWDNVDNMNYLLYVAVVLDPCNKLAYVTYCIELIYGKGSQKSKDIVGLVTKTLEDLFNHYKSKAEKTNLQNTHETIFGESSSSFGEMDIDLELEFDKFDHEGQDIKSEVEIYLSDGREKRDKFDILGWWKVNSIKFPILSTVARHVLAMPISTVASESAFSTGGRVIDKYRSSLNPNTAEALICAQDWIRCLLVDLELGCAMKSKDIDEFNEKMADLKMGKVENTKIFQGSRRLVMVVYFIYVLLLVIKT